MPSEASDSARWGPTPLTYWIGLSLRSVVITTPDRGGGGGLLGRCLARRYGIVSFVPTFSFFGSGTTLLFASQIFFQSFASP